MEIFSDNPSKWKDEELKWIKPYAEAKILGLGEAIHTSDGFYSAKVRLIQYLVEHHNYRAIAWETPWGRALSASHFVKNGEGNVENALNGLFRVWRSTSVANLLVWLRSWNKNNPQDPVRFFGNDTQQAEWDLNCLLNSPRVEEKQKNLLHKLLEHMFGPAVFTEGYSRSSDFKNLMVKGFSDGQDRSTEILDLLASLSFEKAQLEYTAKISLSAFVPYMAKDITGTVTNQVNLRAQSFAHRDQCMSDLTLHFAGKEKTILWAHNWHILRPKEVQEDGVEVGLYYQGQFLQQKLAENYKAIALTASQIEYNWPFKNSSQRGPIISENSLERKLADRFPNKSIFLTSKVEENIECDEYCEEFKFEHDHDISARFDGLIVLPRSGPIEYAVDVMT